MSVQEVLGRVRMGLEAIFIAIAEHEPLLLLSPLVVVMLPSLSLEKAYDAALFKGLHG